MFATSVEALNCVLESKLAFCTVILISESLKSIEEIFLCGSSSYNEAELEFLITDPAAKTLKELETNIKKITQQLGLGEKEFEDCLKNKKNEDTVLQSRIKAQSKYEINSTPTFVINEKKFKGSFSELDKHLEKLL